MNRIDLFLVAGAVVGAAIVYALVGRPGMADQPISARTAEIAQKNPADMTPAETLARLEQLTVDEPDDPEPHFFIGRFLETQGRDDDAIRAYQSALRRDDTFVPAMLSLADIFLRLSDGEVAPETQRIYARAYAVDQTQVRAAFLVGLGEWQAGRRDIAQETWRLARATLDDATPQAEAFDAWVRASTQPEPQPAE